MLYSFKTVNDVSYLRDSVTFLIIIRAIFDLSFNSAHRRKS